MAERRNPEWTAPLISNLKGSDARPLQQTFSSLTDYLAKVQETITANYYNLSVGTVSTGSTSSASISGTFPNQYLNLVLQPGPTGPAGPTGPQGPGGFSTLNLDGGHPDSIYGGLPLIDSGSI